jgi:dienelactone hydrolase
MLPVLQPIHFTNEGLNLWGMLHCPEGVGPHPGVVFLHGFTGQRYEPGWIYVRVARLLAAAGIAAFRFDFRFSGESDGDFQDMTISTEIADAMHAVDLFKVRHDIDPHRIGLLGFSLGATVAAETAARRKDIRSLLLWSPVADPFNQFVEMRKKMFGDTPDVGPVLVGRGFVEDLGNHDPVEATRKWGGPLRVIHGTSDPVVSIDYGRAYMDGPARREIIEVEGAEHGWFGAQNQEDLFTATLDWFRETL